MSADVDIKHLDALRQNTAATLVSALVIASGRPHSIAEVLALMQDVRFSLTPQPGLGSYEAWKQTFTGAEVHK